MPAVFIETTGFTKWIEQHLSEDDYALVQQELLANPNKGTVIPATGGLRKLRVASPRRGKGKRSQEE